MSDLTHQLAVACRELTEVRHQIAIYESNNADVDQSPADEAREKYQALRDREDDLESIIFDLEEEIEEAHASHSKHDYD